MVCLSQAVKNISYHRDYVETRYKAKQKRHSTKVSSVQYERIEVSKSNSFKNKNKKRKRQIGKNLKSNKSQSDFTSNGL